MQGGRLPLQAPGCSVEAMACPAHCRRDLCLGGFTSSRGAVVRRPYARPSPQRIVAHMHTMSGLAGCRLGLPSCVRLVQSESPHRQRVADLMPSLPRSDPAFRRRQSHPLGMAWYLFERSGTGDSGRAGGGGGQASWCASQASRRRPLRPDLGLQRKASRTPDVVGVRCFVGPAPGASGMASAAVIRRRLRQRPTPRVAVATACVVMCEWVEGQLLCKLLVGGLRIALPAVHLARKSPDRSGALHA